MTSNFIKLACGAAFLAVTATAASAQQSTVSTLAAEGYEVKAMSTLDIDPTDNQDTESIFVIMQNGENVYGCALRTATSSFCQRIE